jgi:hypothetical protein
LDDPGLAADFGDEPAGFEADEAERGGERYGPQQPTVLPDVFWAE